MDRRLSAADQCACWWHRGVAAIAAAIGVNKANVALRWLQANSPETEGSPRC
ncbi:hypothetical protein EYF80_060529 [Liparis tanakae]|uniref:Uncharacterized protein n=1 Tax=Liparis tanakae TaxID=230148 RepID=A0A4Z2EKI9_9TELE|nr:hypothetical protein EYF80_060529 [Liparis tanakae]